MHDTDIPNIVILISGSGSNLQAFIDQCAQGKLKANIACVIANRPDAFGIERAQKAKINTRVVDHKAYSTREDFDQALITAIKPYNPSVVILAGFMRILTRNFVREFHGKLLNIHPSLLPKYSGLNTHQRAIDAGDQEAGVTVHFVTEELDGGPPILHAKVPIENNETAENLASKVLKKEHIIYPLVTNWFLSGRLELLDGAAYLDEKPVTTNGISFNSSQLT